MSSQPLPPSLLKPIFSNCCHNRGLFFFFFLSSSLTITTTFASFSNPLLLWELLQPTTTLDSIFNPFPLLKLSQPSFLSLTSSSLIATTTFTSFFDPFLFNCYHNLSLSWPKISYVRTCSQTTNSECFQKLGILNFIPPIFSLVLHSLVVIRVAFSFAWTSCVGIKLCTYFYCIKHLNNLNVTHSSPNLPT